MNCNRALVAHESGGGEGTHRLGVLVVYEDLETGLRASETLGRTVQKLEPPTDVQVDFWRLDLFHEPALLQEVTMQEADIVFFSVHNLAKLPATVDLWFQQWLGRQCGERRALAVSLDGNAKDTPGAIKVKELSAAAKLAGVDVLLHAAEVEAERESTIEDIHRRAERKTLLLQEVLHQVERRPSGRWGINE